MIGIEQRNLPAVESPKFAENHWSFEWFVGLVDYVREWQYQFEVSRTISGPGSESLFEYNSVGHILTRGINSESAEAIEWIQQENWEQAKLELVDQVIFLSSLFNHLGVRLSMGDREFQMVSNDFGDVMSPDSYDGNGVRRRLEESHDVMQASRYVEQFEDMEATLFQRGQFDVDGVLQIQSRIQTEAIEAYRDFLIGNDVKVKRRAMAILVHLSFLFQVMDMSVTDVRDLVFFKMDHNERKYAFEFFGSGLPLNVALSQAKRAFNAKEP